MAKTSTKATIANTDVKAARKLIDEIPRLRTEIRDLKADIDKVNRTNVSLSRENRKLREATQSKMSRAHAIPSSKTKASPKNRTGSAATSTKAASATVAKAPARKSTGGQSL